MEVVVFYFVENFAMDELMDLSVVGIGGAVILVFVHLYGMRGLDVVSKDDDHELAKICFVGLDDRKEAVEIFFELDFFVDLSLIHI